MPDELRPATYRDIIAAEAKKLRIPPELAFALVDQESSGRAGAVGDPVNGQRAQGFFQLMPATAQELGVDPTDPIQNIRGGLTYLRQQLDASTQGDRANVGQALALYHGGPDRQQHGPKTAAYVQAVLGRLQPQPGAPPARGRAVVGQPPPPQVPLPTEETAGAAPLPTLDQPVTFGGKVMPRPGLAAPPSPTTFEQPESWAGWGLRQGAEAASFFDPRTPEGRRNLAGAAGGALAAGALAASAPVTGLAAGTAGVLGAMTGGMMAETGEQAVGMAPASYLNIAKAAGQQGMYEAAGQAVVWPVKYFGRHVVASTVGQAAHTALQSARASTMARLSLALDAASAAAGDVKALAGQTVQFARKQAGIALRGARGVAKAGEEAATTQATARTAAAATPYEAFVAQPPSAAMAGRAAAKVIEGPATEARNIVGKRVEQAAADAPPVDITALKAEAQQILDKIAKPQRTFPRHVAEEGAGLPGGLPGGDAASLARLEQQAAASGSKGSAEARAILAAREKILADLETAQEAAHQETLKHPAMGVISRILNADDVVPFLDAHLWKSELQNALAGTYDKVIKKQVTNITQRLAGGLREALAVHQPYNVATAAYQAIVPLYTKEYAATLRKAAMTDPEALIRTIRAGKPTAARMLRDLLVTQSAEGGKVAEGQAAWDSVRSAWTHQNVLKGGIDALEGNLTKLPKEFSDIFYGDASGQTVLQNIRQIASAYKSAKQTGLFDIAAAKAAGEAQIEATRQAGVRAVEVAQQGAAGVRRQAAEDIRGARLAKREARAPTPEELAFSISSVGPGRVLNPAQVFADLARFLALGPAQIWGGLSGMRLLLKGPRGADLIQWAAYSPQRTQLLVKLFTGASPTGHVISGAGRVVGGMIGQPPPATSPQVATPPPH